MIATEPYSVTLLLFLAVLAGIVFSTFRLLRNFVYPLIKSRKISRWADNWLFRFELIAWSLYVIFLFYELLLDSPVMTLIFIVLILVVGWPFWKDFLPGLLFRIENQVSPGDTIHINGKESTLEEVGFRNLRSISSTGENIITPYHKLNKAVIVRTRTEGKLLKHSFVILLEGKTKNEAIAEITQYLLECPWSAPLETPEVKQTQAVGEYQITAYATDHLAVEKQKAYVAWRLEKAR